MLGSEASERPRGEQITFSRDITKSLMQERVRSWLQEAESWYE